MLAPLQGDRMNARRAWLTTTAALFLATACGPDALVEWHDHEDAPPAIPIDVARGIVEQAVVDCTPRQDTGYSNGNAFPITVVSLDGDPVERDTANAFWVMQQAAADDGVYITINSGFRTYEEQQYFYSCYINCNCNNCNLAATPGYSNHQSGHALDLNTATGGVLNWLNAHGDAFGFARTVPSEDWHWEWWGGGPGGGICGVVDERCQGDADWSGACDGDLISSCDSGTYSEGDCGAFGAQCSTAGGRAHCVHYSCWTHLDGAEDGRFCLDDTAMGICELGVYTEGDCAAYGARCSEEGGAAHCVHPSCWTNLDGGETGRFCVDERTVGECTQGAYSETTCAAEETCARGAGGASCGAPPPRDAALDGPSGSDEQADDEGAGAVQISSSPPELPPSVRGGCSQASGSAPAGGLLAIGLLALGAVRRTRRRA